MLIFSDWIPEDANLKMRGDYNLKSTIGYVLIAMICLYIFINISLMAHTIILNFIAKLRTRRTIQLRL
jgi:hypothetical protein